MKNLTGQIFNNRLVTGLSTQKQGGHWKWSYQCLDCAKVGVMRKSELIKGNCQCVMINKPRPNRIKDMSNQKFGKLTCTTQHRINKHAHAEWLCNCECGNQVWVSRPNLQDGGSTSCGCVNNLIDWNGMRFHSRWEIYIAMVMDALNIQYAREKDKLPVVNPETNETHYYIPDFTIIENGKDKGWVEVKGTHPRTQKRIWKSIQTADNFNNYLIINEPELNTILGTRYRNIDRIYSKDGFNSVYNKITNIMSDITHSNNIKKYLLFGEQL